MCVEKRLFFSFSPSIMASSFFSLSLFIDLWLPDSLLSDDGVTRQPLCHLTVEPTAFREQFCFVNIFPNLYLTLLFIYSFLREGLLKCRRRWFTVACLLAKRDALSSLSSVRVSASLFVCSFPKQLLFIHICWMAKEKNKMEMINKKKRRRR